MIEPLKNKLRLASNFPSPPAIALQIVALASDPEIDVAKVASTISKDPGLTAKVLRVANSPLYANRRKSENLRQALVALGLNAATTLSLGFSLVTAYKGGKGAGITSDATGAARCSAPPRHAQSAQFKTCARWRIFFWRRFSRTLPCSPSIAFSPISIGRCRRMQRTPNFSSMKSCRSARITPTLGHGCCGNGSFRNPLCATVEASHDPPRDGQSSALGTAARCVALGSACVELLLAPQNTVDDLQALATYAAESLGIGAEALAGAMTTIVAEIPEMERLFDTEIMDSESAATILDQARELLMFRNLQALDQMSTLEQASAQLEARTAALEDQQRRDGLTGVFNRRYLDEVLEREFQAAVAGGWPLSIVFADLDRFKDVNDTYGHPAGDEVLIGTARLFLEVRGTATASRGMGARNS